MSTYPDSEYLRTGEHGECDAVWEHRWKMLKDDVLHVLNTEQGLLKSGNALLPLPYIDALNEVLANMDAIESIECELTGVTL